jgi:hypothetical protein
MKNFISLLINNKLIYIGCGAILLIIFIIILIISIDRRKRKKLKKEFKRIEESVDEVKEVQNSSLSKDIEAVLEQMQKNMDAKPEDVVAKFEEEQEKNAIISYQELVENVRTQNEISLEEELANTHVYETEIDDDNGTINFVDKLNKNLNVKNNTEQLVLPIDEDNKANNIDIIEDLNTLFEDDNTNNSDIGQSLLEAIDTITKRKEIKEEPVTTTPVYEIHPNGGNRSEVISQENNKIDNVYNQSKAKKFQTSDFISPVFGKLENHYTYPTIKNKKILDLSNPLSEEELESEMKHSETFLRDLKQFRSNL